MTDTIEWGREIAVDGKRPAWLRADDTKMQWFKDRWGGPCSVRDCNWGPYIHAGKDAPSVTTIRLPADHFAYQALDAGFEPWGGGKNAPADWDGGEVLLAEGDTEKADTLLQGPEPGSNQWCHRDPPQGIDIIGYRKRVTAQPDDTVTVQRMTEAEAYDQLSTDRSGIDALRLLGIIKPDPTPAERFKSDNPEWQLRDRADLIEDVLAWSAKS